MCESTGPVHQCRCRPRAEAKAEAEAEPARRPFPQRDRTFPRWAGQDKGRQSSLLHHTYILLHPSSSSSSSYLLRYRYPSPPADLLLLPAPAKSKVTLKSEEWRFANPQTQRDAGILVARSYTGKASVDLRPKTYFLGLLCKLPSIAQFASSILLEQPVNYLSSGSALSFTSDDPPLPAFLLRSQVP